MTARRARTRGRRPSRAAASLFLTACLAVLVLTFVLGMLVGRQWARGTGASADRIAPALARRSSGARGGAGDADESRRARHTTAWTASDGRGDSPGARPPDLGRGDSPGARPVDIGRGDSPGPRPRTRRLSEREADEPTGPLQERLTFYQALTAPLTAGPPPAAKRPAPSAPRTDTGADTRHDQVAGGAVHEGPYTVQVAAFRSRAQADAVRETLGSAAYVSDAGPGSAAPFRVRFGSFPSRGEAEAAAGRLRGERSLGGFVTRE